MSVSARYEVDLSGVHTLYCKHIPKHEHKLTNEVAMKYDALLIEECYKQVAITFSCKKCLAEVLDEVAKRPATFSLKHVPAGQYNLIAKETHVREGRGQN